MVYDLPGSIVISYLGGHFGNALASLIKCSITDKILYPVGNTFHTLSWPIGPVECAITKESTINFRQKIEHNDIIQLHCLNADLIYYKFPNSKSILLTCNASDEYFGIQRQWLVNTTPIGVNVENILDAWNWIKYNLSYLDTSKRVQQHDKILCLDFKLVDKNYPVLENFLELTLSDSAKRIYEQHLALQLATFYQRNKNFDFAWNIFLVQGASAPIYDLAKEFVRKFK